MNKSKLLLIIAFILVTGSSAAFLYTRTTQKTTDNQTDNLNINDDGGLSDEPLHTLSIESLQKGQYPGSDIVIEQTLPPGSNYARYIASYKSEGLKIYALLTVPNGEKPETGWPVIIFNHGYIPPAQYRTTERYIAYTDGFSRSGYVVFRADYRGHGNSQGLPAGGYGSNAYTIDILNAVASVKKYKDADPDRIGMWGHSMGGSITLKSMVARRDIKAGVIWAGVVGSYPDMLSRWRRITSTPSVSVSPGARRWRQELVERFGSPEANPTFWNSISANSYLSQISGPLQLHHGTADHSVPHEFSQTLAAQMKKAQKEVELYIYPGDEHDIPNNFGIAMQRSVEFFDKFVKGGE